MLMKNRKLYQMLAVTAGVLLLSGCGASSAQGNGHNIIRSAGTNHNF